MRTEKKTPERGERSWYRIENATKAPAISEVYIYDTIGDWGVSAKDFVAEIRGIKSARIDLHINSLGGAVFDGVAIYNALLNHPAHIVSIVDGVAASAASFIAMAGEEIEVEKTARLMIHEASGLTIGNKREMREHADLLESLDQMIAGIYADRAGGEVEHWLALMEAETWFPAEEAVRAGLANRVVNDLPPDPSDKVDMPSNEWPPAWLADTHLKEALS